MLDALAAAYRADSGAVIDALREIGVVNVDVHTPNPDSDPGIQET
jgi:3-dehydroquinate dehydratase